MDDSIDELEPLFDYHRVQPVNFFNLEDDSDSSPAYVSKRRKYDKPSDNKKVEDDDLDGKTVKSVCVNLDDDEEDWLLPPPPPNNSVPDTNREEDSAIKELRIKKQELTALVQSAENALRQVEEASNRATTMSSDFCEEQTTPERTVEPPKPVADRAKIVISIQEKAGTKQYRIYSDDKFEQLFKKYAGKAKIDLDKLIFTFDGDKINPESTPKSLGMEDDDQIEVTIKAQ